MNSFPIEALIAFFLGYTFCISSTEQNNMFNRHLLMSGLLLSISLSSHVQAGWGDLLKQGEQLLQSNSSTSNTTPTRSTSLDSATLAKGLKEALKVGGERAIGRLAESGGYANSADVRIPMPGMLQSVAGLMRKYGLSSQVDAFEASMNLAAEQAISEATPIFLDTLQQMTLDDAKKIYLDGDTAATDYFREHTRTPLTTKLQPLIDRAMSKTGVMSAYTALVNQAEKQIPMFQGMSPDISAHVTSSALDGLFLRLAQQEKRIREQPVARSTELLKQVFGG